MKVPVLILGFNRPNHVIKALEPVKLYEPDKLYLACDGPRTEKDGEDALVSDTQNAMLDAVGWECEIKTRFREKNLGCARAVYEAITWFFEHEEYGIIIEDDVIVGQDFFKLCEELLDFYKYDEKIMMIGAQNRSAQMVKSNQFVYGHYTYIWGWATWRRAWSKMDMNMAQWPSCSKLKLLNTYGMFAGIIKGYYYSMAYNGGMKNSWATRWAFTVFINDGITIIPMVNLAKNIGIGLIKGTNYEVGDKDLYENLHIGKLCFPLIYPKEMKIDKLQNLYAEIDFMRQRLLGLKKKIINYLS